MSPRGNGLRGVAHPPATRPRDHDPVSLGRRDTAPALRGSRRRRARAASARARRDDRARDFDDRRVGALRGLGPRAEHARTQPRPAALDRDARTSRLPDLESGGELRRASHDGPLADPPRPALLRRDRAPRGVAPGGARLGALGQRSRTSPSAGPGSRSGGGRCRGRPRGPLVPGRSRAPSPRRPRGADAPARRPRCAGGRPGPRSPGGRLDRPNGRNRSCWRPYSSAPPQKTPGGVRECLSCNSCSGPC